MKTARDLIKAAQGKKRMRRPTTPDSQNNEEQIELEPENIEEEQAGPQIVNFEVSKSQKGAAVIWPSLRSRKKSAKIQYWACDMKIKMKCPVRAQTSSSDFTNGTITPSSDVDEHVHLPRQTGVEAERRLNIFKNRINEEPQIPASDLIAELKNDEISDEVFVDLPSEGALRQYATKHRKQMGGLLNSQNVGLIQIPGALRMKNGKPFLIYDSLAETDPIAKNRLLIFASENALQHLQNQHHWSIDATFRARPKVFNQLLVIGGFVQHKVIPLAYALMTSKERQPYEEVLSQLKNHLLVEQYPDSIMTDYESGLLGAIAIAFPAAKRAGCLFHLAQSFLRRFKNEGLIKRWKEENVRMYFRWTISLAFLPLDKVRRGFSLIVNRSPPGLERYFFYIAKNYIGLSQWEHQQKHQAFCNNADANRMMNEMGGVGFQHQQHQQRASTDSSISVRSLLSGPRRSSIITFTTDTEDNQPQHRDNGQQIEVEPRYGLPIIHLPQFAPRLWNVRERVLTELPRCQASMEAGHLALQKRSKTHPRMYDFLIGLHQFDTKKMQEIREAILKPGSVRRRKEFVEMDRTLLHLCRNSPLHTDQHIAIFLQAVSLALKQLMNDLADPTGAENDEEIGDDDEENEREIDVENEIDAVNLHVSPLHLDSFDSPNSQNPGPSDPSVPSTSGSHSSLNLDHIYC